MFHVIVLSILSTLLCAADFKPWPMFCGNEINLTSGTYGPSDRLAGVTLGAEKNIFKMVPVYYAAGQNSIPGVFTEKHNICFIGGYYGRTYAKYDPATELQPVADGLNVTTGGPQVNTKIRELPFWVAYPLWPNQLKLLNPAQRAWKEKWEKAVRTADLVNFNLDRLEPCVTEFTQELADAEAGKQVPDPIDQIRKGLALARQNLAGKNKAVCSSRMAVCNVLYPVWLEYATQVR